MYRKIASCRIIFNQVECIVVARIGEFKYYCISVKNFYYFCKKKQAVFPNHMIVCHVIWPFYLMQGNTSWGKKVDYIRKTAGNALLE